MKKILSFFALAALLLTASCSKQESPVLGEDQVIISLGLEGVSATRAISDGSLVDKLVYEVYDKTGALLVTMDGMEETVTFPYSLSLPLAKGQDYTILFWAQNSDCGAYNTEDLRSVTVDYTDATNNDETRDAFYAAVNVHVTGGPQKVEVVLNRPFAQVNVAVPQAEWQRAIDAGVKVEKSSVKFSEVASNINLATGAVSNPVNDVTLGLANIPTERLSIDLNKDKVFTDDEKFVYLSMDYILVNDGSDNGAEKSMINTATFTFKSSVNDVTLSVPNLPVQRNYRTNVLGTFLVDYVDFNIIVDPIYNTPDEVYPDTDVEYLYDAAANGGEVTLTEDVTLTEPLEIIANATINLGGKTLTGSVTVADGVQATISNGKIINEDNSVSGITSNGDLTINNVEIESARHALRIESGKVIINGGTYKVVPVSKSTLYALNVGDGASSVANVVIKGGTFIGPKGTMADSGGALTVKVGSSVKIEGGDFSGGKTKTLSNNGTLIISGGSFDQDPKNYVADGYKAIPKDGKYYVVEDDIDVVATTTDELKSALNNSEQVYVVKGNYTFPTSSIKEGQTIICEEGTVFTGNSKLNINGAKVINGTFSNPNGTAVDQTINGVFENCTFTGSNALRWCYAGETVEFINCVFDGDVYGVHFDGGANVVKFENCVLSGFNAFASVITSLTFNDCIFKSNGRSGYNGANLWCGATMSNCEFTFDGSTTNEWIDCINVDGTYKFDNCTIKGIKYTSDNYDDYDEIFSRNHAKVTINDVECKL